MTNDLLQRRGFLRGLAALPLIGGGVTLIGNPTKAAVPVTRQLLETYHYWLDYERMMLVTEMDGPSSLDGRPHARTGWQYHFPKGPNGEPFAGWSKVHPALQPSRRAAVVLSAVGCREVAPVVDERTTIEVHLDLIGIDDPVRRARITEEVLKGGRR
jgi:hypothetical protein